MVSPGMISPDQFGGQGTLFDAPHGQPEMGMTKGNPALHLYRMVKVPNEVMERGSHEDILNHINRPGHDGGHSRNMGIHWQHDLSEAHDWAFQTYQHNDETHTPVIIEAEHPGHKHVVDYETTEKPKEANASGRHNNKLTGTAKDWSIINDTVGAHDDLKHFSVEVPIRPGTPMRVRAIHTPNTEVLGGEMVRNPIKKFTGQA